MTLLVASDLDQTLIFSPRAAARGPHRPSRVIEVLEGATISLLSSGTEQGLVRLARSAVVVPATTRTRAQFTRLDLPLRSRYAIVASGAVILVDGEPDLDWSRGVAERLGLGSAPVAALQAVLQGFDDREWLLRVRDADDVFLVAAVDADLLHGAELEEVTASCSELGWRAVHQGRKLYLLPNALDKAAAVREVARRVAEEHGQDPVVLAAGDTDLDRGMLETAAHGWFPAGSELDRLGYAAPHVTRTAEAAFAASEEILRAWLQRAEDDQPPGGREPSRTASTSTTP
jgi:hypothetical protein